MNATEGFAVRVVARMLMVTLVLAAVLQLLALSREDRQNFWLTGSLCVRAATPAR